MSSNQYSGYVKLNIYKIYIIVLNRGYARAVGVI